MRSLKSWLVLNSKEKNSNVVIKRNLQQKMFSYICNPFLQNGKRVSLTFVVLMKNERATP